MHNIKRRVMGSLMAVLMSSSTILGTCPAPIFATVASEVVTSDASQVDANSYALASATEGNILHAWDWKFTDVTNSMEDIAKAGYSLVQVSPCQKCEDVSTNNDWWRLYQPYDYDFGNSLGDEAAFREMCATAKEYGIAIIVDVVANHMAGTGKGTCGERKSEVIKEFWTDDKFHNTNVKFTGDYDNNREMMVLSNIGMPDVDTSNKAVQQRMITYLEKMLDMGAGGFRYDAAKHIGTTSDTDKSYDDFWKNISAAVSAKKPDALVYGEILNRMPVTDEYYVQDGIKVTESQKGWDMKDILKDGPSKVTDETAFTYTRKASADKLITWVENHDTYLNQWGSTGIKDNDNYMSDEGIMLAWSTVAARANTQSLYFARPDGCSVPEKVGDPDACNKIEGNLGMSTKNFDWKDQKVASINKFKNAMTGTGEKTWTSNGLAIIQRGDKGVVVTNYSDGNKSVEVSGLSGLKDGTYKDASGQNGDITVSGGKASIEVKGKTFVVLYDANAVVVPTEVPATTAPATGAAQIKVSKDTCEFTEKFDTTIEVTEAEYAYYSYDGAAWKEIKNGKETVTVGADAKEVGDAFALYVKAKGKDGKVVDVTKTYTYAATASVEVTVAPITGLKVRVKKSEFGFEPFIYVFDLTHAEGKAYTGKWPGKKMDVEGEYYVYTASDITGEVTLVFSDGTNNDKNKTKDIIGVKGYVEYSNGAVTPVTDGGAGIKTSAPATASPNAKKANKAPDFVEPGQATEEPTKEPTSEPTAEPQVKPVISVDVQNKTQFDDETIAVKISVENADKAYYTVDGGYKEEFTGSTTVNVGEGKIADTDVVLSVTAEGSETVTTEYTYEKIFNQAKAAASQSVTKITAATTKIASLFDVVEEVAQVAALSGEPESSYFATNPNKQTGAKKTITSAKDFTEDMIIAQGVANDSVTIFRGSHEGPVYDSYAMFGAYDDKNVYIGVQYTNVIDVVDPAQNYPQSDNGNPQAGNIPQMMVFDTRSGDYTDGTANDTKQKTAWDTNVKFAGDANVDRLFLYAAKPNENNTAFFKSVNGIVDYSTVISSKLPATGSTGITYTYESGFFCSKMYGIKDNGYSGYTPDQLNSDDSKWVDFLAEGHDTVHDNFMLMTIPMETLGVNAEKVANDGIGVMAISTFGESGIGSLPQDLSMLDVACEPYAADTSSSHEKDDEDTVTVKLAQLGGTITGETKTPRPHSTEAPVVATPNATETATSVDETPAVETPVVATADPAATNAPIEGAVTEAPEHTKAPIVTDKADQMVVDFGANKAAPQAAGTSLALSAKVYNATEACTYQFAVNDKVVQNYSESSSCEWMPTEAGVYKLRVTVKSGDVYVGVEKSFTVKGESVEPRGDETAAPEATKVPGADQEISETAVPVDAVTAITVKLQKSLASSQKVGTKIVLKPIIAGGSGQYTYSIKAELKDGAVYDVATNVDVTKTESVTWTPKKAGKYILKVSVTDSLGNKGVREESYTITAKTTKALKITSYKVSKSTVKRGKSVKFTVKGTAKKGTLKFKFVVKKGKKTIATRKYSKTKTYTWKTKKKTMTGKYTVIVYAKDGSGKYVKKSKTIEVKK